jgi:hypothetical protein
MTKLDICSWNSPISQKHFSLNLLDLVGALVIMNVSLAFDYNIIINYIKATIYHYNMNKIQKITHYHRPWKIHFLMALEMYVQKIYGIRAKFQL